MGPGFSYPGQSSSPKAHTVIDLSVLICSTNTRADTFGRAIQQQVWPQIDALPTEYRDRIEVLMLTDNKSMMLGHKRNVMVDMAQGRYVQFIDDDDRIEPDMFRTVLDALDGDADVVTFLVSVSLNGNHPKTCRYSIDFTEDTNTGFGYERLPNHICVIKRELARQVSYPHLPHGEDSGYAKLLHPLLKSETHIPRVLYHYDYNLDTTEAQQHLRNESRPRRDVAPIADIVILSNGSTPNLRHRTQMAVDSCISGANGLNVGVAVLEQQPDAVYRRCATVHMPAQFHYNAFANFGAGRGSAPWIVIANNDLVFHDGWLHTLLAANHPLVSPKCPRDERQSDITENTLGDITGKHLSGWCFMISRDLWERIGGFDQCVSFWCSDDVVIEQAKAEGVQPMLVPGSLVEHVQSQTLIEHGNRDDLTWAQLNQFIGKYGSHRLQNHPEYLRWKQSQSALSPT
jgi:GT2 family glycosyltransferase